MRQADRHPGVRVVAVHLLAFVPMFFLQGIARFLFIPMAEAVIFAMISSFVLSRTLVPTMAKYLLRRHAARANSGAEVPRALLATRWALAAWLRAAI